MLRHLAANVSGNNETKSDKDFYEKYASLGHHENTSEGSDSSYEPSDPNVKAGAREAEKYHINYPEETHITMVRNFYDSMQ